jgi:predicted permease
MESLLLDLRLAARALRRTPGFALVAAGTLALGIAANTVIFSVVEGVLIRPLPYADPDRLAIVWNDYGQGQSLPAVSGSDFVDYRARGTAVAEFEATTSARANLSGVDGDPEQVEVGRATAGFLPLLGIQPLLGRLFTASEAVVNGPPVVVLTHALWQRRFAGDPAVVGRTIVLNGVPSTVVGVLPESFRLVLPPERFVLDQPAVWAPVQQDLPSTPRNFTTMTVFARLRPGMTFARLQETLDRIAAQLRDEHPVHRQSGLRIRAVPLRDDVVKRVRPPLYALAGAVGLVLLVACANVANLLLARATARSRELAVRAALGAGAARLARAVLAENLLLAAAGGVAGVLLAAWGVDALLLLHPASVPRSSEVRLDGGVLAFAAGASILAALLPGVLPALQASRLPPADAIRTGRTETSAPGHVRTRHALVVAETAVSVLLLVCAGLLLRSFGALQAAQPGFDPASVYAFEVQLPPARYPDAAALRAFGREAERRLAAIPGVTDVGTVRQLPLTGSGPQQPYAWDDDSAQRWESVSADWRSASPGYFHALRMRLAAGRWFDERDDEKHPPVILVDTVLARSVFPNGDAVGKRLLLEPQAGQRVWHEIVGVVEHPRLHDLARAVRGQIYQPEDQLPTGRRAMVVRASGDPAALVRQIETAVHAIDGNLALRGLGPLSKVVDDARAPARFVTTLGVVFAILALSMAAVGLFGVLSFSVRQRTQEIGVRMALGASERSVLSMVLQTGLRLSLYGVALGLAGAAICGRFLASSLVGVTPHDALTFATVPAVLLSCAVVACWVPALRAARVDPAVALREG